MGRPRKKPWERKPPQFEPGQMVEPIESYVGEIDGQFYSGHPGTTRLDASDPAVRQWPEKFKLLDPKAYEDKA